MQSDEEDVGSKLVTTAQKPIPGTQEKDLDLSSGVCSVTSIAISRPAVNVLEIGRSGISTPTSDTYLS